MSPGDTVTLCGSPPLIVHSTDGPDAVCHWIARDGTPHVGKYAQASLTPTALDPATVYLFKPGDVVKFIADQSIGGQIVAKLRACGAVPMYRVRYSLKDGSVATIEVSEFEVKK